MSNTESNKPANRGGFTLAEILLVMLIISILALGINAAYRQARSIWSHTESRRPIYHNARLIIETLRQELSGLYLPAASDNGGRSGEDSGQSPFSLSTLPNGTTELTFYTLTPSWKRSSMSSRVARVRYSFTGESTEERLLQRFEQLCAGEKLIGEESSSIIATDMTDFKLWALDAGADSHEDPWKQSYNSEAPPGAVKISLKWAASKENPEIGFQSCILVPCSSSIF